MPSYAFSLKIGTPIILLRNINLLTGLCNVIKLNVTQLVERVIKVQIIIASNIGSHVFIPKIVFHINEGRCPFTIRQRQFPIRPCYGMIINKIQRQSLKVIGIFLKEHVFNHDQLVVAFSRVTSNNRLKIITYDNKGKPFNYTKNIVYKDVIGSISRE